MKYTYEELKAVKFNKTAILTSFKKMEKLINELNENNDEKKVLLLLDEINLIRDSYLTKYWLSYIGYLLNTTDSKYLKSEKLISELDPIMENLKRKYYKIIINLKMRAKLEKVLGPRLFAIAENESVLQNDDINSYVEKEKELHKKHLNLIINTKFSFNNEEINLSGLNKYLVDSSRDVRKKAYDKRFEVLISLEKEIDNIYDELIKTRTKKAKKLGFNSYSEVGNIQMNRIDYGKKEIEIFRNQIKKYIIPLMKKLKDMQKKRLGLEKLNYFDSGFLFPDGNAKVIIDLPEVILVTSKIIGYNSKESQKLFDNMFNNGFIDLSSNPEKSSGGITTYLPDYQIPMFIKKYQGLEDNICTIHHEFGHAQQLYYSRNLKYHENRWPTFDICEIHATAMEFLMYPYIEEYFGKDYNKYKIKHLTKIISTLISTSLNDEFQQFLYDNPEISKKHRKSKWLELCKEYSINEDKGHEYLKKGIEWQANSNSIDMPFYCIDYALAAISGLSFYEMVNENNNQAWKSFIKLCKYGGSKSLIEIIELVNLKNPFIDNSIKNIAQFLEKEIKKISL